MILILNSHVSQDFWRLVYPANRTPDPAPTLGFADYGTALDNPAFTESDIRSLAPRWLNDDFLACGTSKIDVMVFDESRRRNSPTRISRRWTGPIPEGSFYKLESNVLVCSPCFTFLRLATELSPAELVAYGCEICGIYSFDPRTKRGMVEREAPLVTKQQLLCYLENAKGCRGHSAALRAARFIVERCGSPMETCIVLFLCLPYRLGGYGISFPEMNYPIPVPPRAASLAGRQTCIADLLWRANDLVIEYQGDFDHSRVDSFADDRGRIDALISMGYEVLEITYKQAWNTRAFEEIALHVAQKVGKRVRIEGLGLTATRNNLRAELRSWNAHYGHLPM